MSFPLSRVPLNLKAELETLSVDQLEIIGEGNFTVVYESQNFAIKAINKQRVQRLHKEADVLMEKHALRRLSHENIVQLIHTWTDSDHCYIACELCPNGELWESCRGTGEPERRSKIFFRQILDGVQYMHRMGIVHRDLKAENIFLCKNGTVAKIGDFGSSRDIFNNRITGSGNKKDPLIGRAACSFQHYVGSANFLSPEALDNKENDELSDIWSLGCLFYQVLIGIPPFSAGSEYLIYLRMKSNDLVFPPCGISETCVDLVRSIIVHDRTSRPTISDILRHDFFCNTTSVMPCLTREEVEIKRSVRSGNFRPDDACRESKFDSTYALERLKMAAVVREWELQSQPGSGTAMLEHLGIPGSSFGHGHVLISNSETS